ncbi:MAG: glucose 1-dehydrogenase [Planctomycetia bacterium]|nr:glucose 1-dehydrogenase [Planctomycetia bacterium]
MSNSLLAGFDLNGKVALVTGASKGIGAAIAQGLATCGALVVVSSRKQDAVEAVAAEIRTQGGKAEAIAAHAGDPAQLRSLVDACTERCGGVDILVNNAATNPKFGPLLDQNLDVFEKTLAVNLKGPFELCRLVHPLMRARGGGSIINISSIGGLRPEPMLGLYNVSKAALLSLTQAMAREWGGDQIRVNAICPGLVQTKFSEALWRDEATLRGFLERVPLGRMAQSEDIAPLAVFLASPASGYCTGAIFTIDGGLTI